MHQTLKPQYQNSYFLPLYVSYRNSGEKLLIHLR